MSAPTSSTWSQFVIRLINCYARWLATEFSHHTNEMGFTVTVTLCHANWPASWCHSNPRLLEQILNLCAADSQPGPLSVISVPCACWHTGACCAPTLTAHFVHSTTMCHTTSSLYGSLSHHCLFDDKFKLKVRPKICQNDEWCEVYSLQTWHTTKDEWKTNPPLTASKIDRFLNICYDLSQRRY